MEMLDHEGRGDRGVYFSDAGEGDDHGSAVQFAFGKGQPADDRSFFVFYFFQQQRDLVTIGAEDRSDGPGIGLGHRMAGAQGKKAGEEGEAAIHDRSVYAMNNESRARVSMTSRGSVSSRRRPLPIFR